MRGSLSRSQTKVSGSRPMAWSSRRGKITPNRLASVSRGSRSTSPIVFRPRASSRSRRHEVTATPRQEGPIKPASSCPGGTSERVVV